MQVSTYYNTFLSIIDIRVAGIHPSNCHQPLASHDHNFVVLQMPKRHGDLRESELFASYIQYQLMHTYQLLTLKACNFFLHGEDENKGYLL